MKTKILAYFAAFLSLAGCEPPFQPAGLTPVATNIQKAIVSTTAATNSNIKNPFDSIGIWHNVILDSLHTYTLKTSDTTKGGIRKYIAGFAKRHWNIELSTSSKLLLPLWDKENRDYKKLLLHERLSDTGQMLQQELFRAIDSIKSIEYFDRFQNKIEDIEKRVLANKGLSEKEHNLLLVMTAVARHSAYYWEDKFGNIPDEIFARKKKGLFKKILKCISTVGADVTSAGFYYLENRPIPDIISDAANMSYLVYSSMTLYWEW